MHWFLEFCFRFGLVQPGVWALEKSLMRLFFSFFLCFREIRKKLSHWPGGQLAPRLYNSSGYNLCPCAGPAHVGEGQGPSSSSPKQWKSDGRVKAYNSVCARSPFDEIQERKNYREHSNIISAHVSTLTGSVPHEMAEALQSVSALIRNQTHVAWLSADYLNH